MHFTMGASFLQRKYKFINYLKAKKTFSLYLCFYIEKNNKYQK